MKRGIYMKGKISKLTHYDKYGPNSSFTKAAAGVKIFLKLEIMLKIKLKIQNQKI